MVETITQEWVADQRSFNYHRTPNRRIQSVEAAREFVAELGFCHFWPVKGAELPNLFHAIAGRIRPVPMEHDDPDISKCWGWKDSSLGKRWWYYGKLLRKRATLISLDLLPAFWACSDNLGELDDYLEEYHAGRMPTEAKWIYEALLQHGPLHTIQLRRAARMSAQGAKSRFQRGLVELQVGLKVLPIGVARAGAWRYAFVYDIVQRHFPDLPEQASQMKPYEARRVLVSRYLDNVVASDRKNIGKIFHVLGWSATEVEHTVAALLKQGAIREMQVDGVRHAHLVSSRVLERNR